MEAKAAVEVVMAPCRLELTPAGPIDLPLGQMMRLQGVANYSGGRCVQVPSERLKWFSQEKSVPGLELSIIANIVRPSAPWGPSRPALGR